MHNDNILLKTTIDCYGNNTNNQILNNNLVQSLNLRVEICRLRTMKRNVNMWYNLLWIESNKCIFKFRNSIIPAHYSPAI